MTKPEVLTRRPARPCQHCGRPLDEHARRSQLCPSTGRSTPGVITRFSVVPYTPPPEPQGEPNPEEESQ